LNAYNKSLVLKLITWSRLWIRMIKAISNSLRERLPKRSRRYSMMNEYSQAAEATAGRPLRITMKGRREARSPLVGVQEAITHKGPR